MSERPVGEASTSSANTQKDNSNEKRTANKYLHCCEVCATRYASKQSLRRHWLCKHPDKSMPAFLIGDQKGDNEQKERKFLQKAFQCTECNNGYVYASSLKTHYEKCHKDFVPATNMDKERENSSCQNSSNSSTDKQSILDKKQCPFCNKLLKERRSAVQHYRIKHSIYHCSKCFFEVKNKIRAKIHWLKFHRKFKRPEYLKNVKTKSADVRSTSNTVDHPIDMRSKLVKSAVAPPMKPINMCVRPYEPSDFNIAETPLNLSAGTCSRTNAVTVISTRSITESSQPSSNYFRTKELNLQQNKIIENPKASRTEVITILDLSLDSDDDEDDDVIIVSWSAPETKVKISVDVTDIKTETINDNPTLVVDEAMNLTSLNEMIKTEIDASKEPKSEPVN